MPGFLDVLRGAVDTAGTARQAKAQADDQDAEQSVGLLLRLRQMAEAQQLHEAQLGEIGARTDYYKHRAEAPLARPLTNQERLTARIQELTSGGLSATDANRQARAELGYAMPTTRPPNPNVEPPAHRDARQAAASDLRALSVTQGDIKRNEKTLSGPFATPADSARVMPIVSTLRARADSIQRAYDQHRASMDAASGLRSSTAAPAPSAPRTPTTAPRQLDPNESSAMQHEFDLAAARYRRLIQSGAAADEARTAYDATVSQIARKYGQAPQ